MKKKNKISAPDKSMKRQHAALNRVPGKKDVSGRDQDYKLLRAIKNTVARNYGLREADFASKTHDEAILLPRQLAIYLACDLTDLPLAVIADAFGDGCGLVLEAKNKISEYLRTDILFSECVDELVQEIGPAGYTGKGADTLTGRPKYRDEFVKWIKNRKSQWSRQSVLTGFPMHSCPGFEKGKVTMVAFSTGGGKTGFVVSALNHVLNEGKYGAAVYVPDHNTNTFMERLVAARAGMEYPIADMDSWRTPESWDNMISAADKIASSGLWLSQRRFLCTDDILEDMAEVENWLKKRGKKPEMLIIDSLNSIKENDDTPDGINWSLDQLKFIAEHWNIAVVVTYTVPQSKIPTDGIFKLRDIRAAGINEKNLDTILCFRVSSEVCRTPLRQSEVEMWTTWSNSTIGEVICSGIKFSRRNFTFQPVLFVEMPFELRPEFPSDIAKKLKEKAASKNVKTTGAKAAS